ncbi:MAG: hypothetical protein OHK0039_41320 [Bacteroidia bacterium]
MNILTFDLSGKFAHFRKYYANNTALSYFIPPRTTLMGMLAAAMGYPRDSYYEALASEHIRLGLRILSPLKKRIHRVNWLKIEGAGDFRGQKQHTQTPFELVSGLSPQTDLVRYRVYVSAHDSGLDTWGRLAAVLMSGRQQVFPVSLGSANFSGSIEGVRLFEQVPAHTSTDAYVWLHSAVNSEHVAQIDWDGQGRLMIEEELTPADFVANHDRELRKMVRLLYATDGQPMRVRYSGPYWQLPYGDHEERICFIE